MSADDLAMARARGRIAAAVPWDASTPPDRMTWEMREAWWDGYRAERACPTVVAMLTRYPTKLSRRVIE